MKLSLPTLAAASALAIVACERKTVVVVPASPPPAIEPVSATKTLETQRLASAVDAYERQPSAENLADTRKAFSELDGEIAELEKYIATHDGAERATAEAKHQNLTAYRTAQTTRFTALQAKAPVLRVTPPDARSGAEKVEDAAKRVGGAVEEAGKEVGNAIKDAVR